MLIALASAKGSPGVSTVAEALSSVWPRRAILADCDPAGGDMALRLRDQHGVPLEPERGLLSLAAAARRGIDPGEVFDHVQTAAGGLEALTGVIRPEQLTGVGPVWPAVADALRDVPDTDVIADCGRVTPGSPVLPLVSAADALVVIVRPGVEAYAHLRERLRWLHEPLRIGQIGAVPVGVVVIAGASDNKATRELNQLLEYDGLKIGVIGRVADDTKAAEVLAGLRTRRIDRSLLVRSVRQLTSAVHELANRSQAPAKGR